MKFKKAILTVGTIVTVATPIGAVVSCGASITPKHYKLLPTYTGQADQLLALGIAPDYYPWQLNISNPYAYLTNPSQYMARQPESFRNAFSAKLKSLMGQIGDQGRTWWNQNAEKNSNTNPNPEYWTTKTGDLTLYEHYLLDDEIKVITSDKAPSYDAAIQTNFRWSQDPYTRLSKDVIDNAIDTQDIDGVANMTDADKVLAKEIQRIFGLRDKDMKIVDSMWVNGVAQFDDESKWDTNAKLFNDAWFAYSYHTGFLDNPQLKTGGAAENFEKFMLDGSNPNQQSWIFNSDPAIDAELRDMFEKSTISADQKSKGLTKINYQSPTSAHHPIYDAQTKVGEAPVYEGARRENMLYLYNLASQLTHTVSGQNARGEEGNAHEKAVADKLAEDFKGDARLDKMKDALSNANKIAGDLDTRLNAIKEYFKAIGVDGKTIALTTVAPGGGVSTIQTNSKYSFMFERLGLNYAMPTQLKNSSGEPDVDSAKAALDFIKKDVDKGTPSLDTAFSMDDNGWFWNLGNGSTEFQNSSMFAKSADVQILAVRPQELKGMTDASKQALANIQKTDRTVANLDSEIVNYDLWNEGLKTPFVINMMLDDIITRMEKTADQSKVSAATSKLTDALNWGNYWTVDYVK